MLASRRPRGACDGVAAVVATEVAPVRHEVGSPSAARTEDRRHQMTDDSVTTFDLGDGIEIRLLDPATLHEQSIDAQIMSPTKFDQLVANIRARGALESFPYCWEPFEGVVEIVSGHHRTRAAVVAGLEVIPVIVDTLAMTAEEVRAKQIAHNALTGESDTQVLAGMMKDIKGPDLLLRSGLSADLLPTSGTTGSDLLSTQAPTFDVLAAKAQVADGGSVDEEWVPLQAIIGSARVPPEVAEIIELALAKLMESGDVTEAARWRVLELACAELLAAP